MSCELIYDQGQPTIVLHGDLDEDFDPSQLLDLINQVYNKLESDQRLRILLRDVPTGNSTGLHNFLSAISCKDVPISYAEVPQWIMLQFNFLAELLQGDIFVESILVDGYCKEKNITHRFILKIGKDIPILKEYPESAIKLKYQGDIYVAELESCDLSFIANNYERFKKICSK